MLHCTGTQHHWLWEMASFCFCGFLLMMKAEDYKAVSDDLDFMLWVSGPFGPFLLVINVSSPWCFLCLSRNSIHNVILDIVRSIWECVLSTLNHCILSWLKIDLFFLWDFKQGNILGFFFRGDYWFHKKKKIMTNKKKKHD